MSFDGDGMDIQSQKRASHPRKLAAEMESSKAGQSRVDAANHAPPRKPTGVPPPHDATDPSSLKAPKKPDCAGSCLPTQAPHRAPGVGPPPVPEVVWKRSPTSISEEVVAVRTGAPEPGEVTGRVLRRVRGIEPRGRPWNRSRPVWQTLPGPGPGPFPSPLSVAPQPAFSILVSTVPVGPRIRYSCVYGLSLREN